MTFEVKADDGVGGQAIGRGKMVFCGLVWSDEGDLLVALKKAQVTTPVAGTRMVEEDREVGRSWQMLTITSSGIEPLPGWVPPTPAPE